MCGICGIFSENQLHFNALKAMNDKLIHRGPDGEGFFYSTPIALAHRRLSIIDLSDKGKQPMHYLNRYTITYNGEIYNYIELKKELENNGYLFESHTDTEVIMAAYDCWGTDCLNRFNGMWAFVLFDSQTQQVLISRDRLGIKPLYYYQKNGLFAFASEIKALLVHPEISTAIRKDWCQEYLKNGLFKISNHTEYDLSAYQDIHEFKASHFVLTNVNTAIYKSLNFQRYWEIPANYDNESYNETKLNQYLEEYRYLLNDAVRIRLRSDVPVGTALGGLDSSIISHLINQNKSGTAKQMTFSSVYRSENTKYCDESEFINKLSQHLKVENQQIEPTDRDVLTDHQKVIYAMDIPVNSSCLSGWNTFKLISQSPVKVTLDGQGADEILAGYLSYLIFYLSGLSLKNWLKQTQIYGTLPGTKTYLIKSLLLKYMRGAGFSTGFIRDKLRLTHDSPHINQVLKEDLLSSFRLLLFYGDRESMAFSVESRLPYCDYRLIELMLNMPVEYKLHQGWTKYLSRKAFENELPHEIIWRKDKMGWAIPDTYWFNHLYKGTVLKSIQQSEFARSLLSKKQFEQLPHHYNLMFRAYNLSVWGMMNDF